MYRRVSKLPVNVYRHFCCSVCQLATKRSEKRTADVTFQCRKRLSESKTQVAHCAASGTVCELRTESTSAVL